MDVDRNHDGRPEQRWVDYNQDGVWDKVFVDRNRDGYITSAEARLRYY